MPHILSYNSDEVAAVFERTQGGVDYYRVIYAGQGVYYSVGETIAFKTTSDLFDYWVTPLYFNLRYGGLLNVKVDSQRVLWEKDREKEACRKKRAKEKTKA